MITVEFFREKVYFSKLIKGLTMMSIVTITYRMNGIFF